jgi:magnesium-transporting ATPase (P-type)
LATFGKNILEKKKKFLALRLLSAQLNNPLVFLLFAAAVISYVVEDFTAAVIIGGVIVLTAILGFVQEYRSEKALEKLKRMITFKAKVIRDGEKTEVDVSDIVPGDIVLLEVGDRVPADMRLISEEALFIDEAVLTRNRTRSPIKC